MAAKIVNSLIRINFLDSQNSIKELEVTPETFYQVKATLNFLLESLTEASKCTPGRYISRQVDRELNEIIKVVNKALVLINEHYETELIQGTIDGDFLLFGILNIHVCIAAVSEKTNAYLARNSKEFHAFCSPKYEQSVQFIFWHQLYCLLNTIEGITQRDILKIPFELQDNIMNALREKPFDIDETLYTILAALFTIIDEASDKLDYNISNIPGAINQQLIDLAALAVARTPVNQSELKTYHRIQGILQARPKQRISIKMAKAFIEVEDLFAEAGANGDLLAIATELGLSLENQDHQSQNPAIFKIAQNIFWLKGFMDEIMSIINDIQNQSVLPGVVCIASSIVLQPRAIPQEVATAKELLGKYPQWLKCNKNQVPNFLPPQELKNLRKFLAIVNKIQIKNPECNLMATLLSDKVGISTYGLAKDYIKKPQNGKCQDLFCVRLSYSWRLVARDSGGGQVEVLFVDDHDEYDRFLNSYKP
ncbi:MAG: hypothetical protein H7230_02715 [Candidatus Parcubacteria bacterium]|nr:hypothetical protein [Candidatus Paceibacterota bacterium]